MHFERISLAIRDAFLALFTATLLAGCGNRVEDRQGRGDPPAYVAGLGEIMGLNQMRHAKLWFAGKAENWPLAAYEIDEIREGFGDAERYHPRHKTVPEPMRQMIEEYVDGPLAHLDEAVRKQDNAAFITAFDDLTQGCNACHRASGFGYNVVTRPTSPPYSNQSFAPAEADANGTG